MPSTAHRVVRLLGAMHAQVGSAISFATVPERFPAILAASALTGMACGHMIWEHFFEEPAVC